MLPATFSHPPTKPIWEGLSTEGNLTFNSELLQQPAEVRARVIVEGLLHMKVPNHGKLFKALVKSHLAQGRGRPA